MYLSNYEFVFISSADLIFKFCDLIFLDVTIALAQKIYIVDTPKEFRTQTSAFLGPGQIEKTRPFRPSILANGEPDIDRAGHP